MRTLNQLKKRVRKTQRSAVGVEELFLTNNNRAKKIWDRATGAINTYKKEKNRLTAHSMFKTKTQALKAVNNYKKAENKVNEFLKQFNGLKTPADMLRLTQNTTERKKYSELSALRSKEWQKAQLAELAFPKVKKEKS